MSSVNLKQQGKIAFVEWDNPHSKINILSEKSLSEFSEVIEKVSKSSVEAVIIISKKPSVFIAGADLNEVQKLKTKEEFSERITKAQKIFENMRNNKNISFIAAIRGAALGGGAELALHCDYRVAFDHPETKIGFPEVNLGIMPGFGGSVLLPRIAGLLNSLDLILTGKSITARKARKMGFVDEVEVIEGELRQRALKLAERIIKGEKLKKPKNKKVRNSFLEMFPFKTILFFILKRRVLKKTKGFYPAPIKILNFIQKTYPWPEKKAIEEEKKYFCELAVSSISRNLIHLFFMSEKAKKQAVSEEKTPSIKRIGVLGAGVMGSGIAYTAADKGFEARIQDIRKESLIQAKNHIHSLLKKQIRRKKINSFEEKMKRSLVSYSADLEGFQTMDIVIEAVSEDINIKRKVIEKISSRLKPLAVLATNTSSLSVAEISTACRDPSRFVGLHFFNPPYRLPLVEVIQGEKTSAAALSLALRFTRDLGKIPIVVKDSPGFLVNRLLMPWLTEALWLLGEGMDIFSIDKVFSKKFGFPMGPFRLMDEVGLDVCVKVIESFQKAGLLVSAPSFIFDLAQEGRLGKKNFLGFYHYKEDGRASGVNQEMENKFYSVLDSKNTIDKKEALKRGLYRMINESALVLSEQIVSSAERVDLAMVMGAGFPPFCGGPLRWADSIGIKNIVSDLEKWSSKGCERFKPCTLIKEKAVKNQTFY